MAITTITPDIWEADSSTQISPKSNVVTTIQGNTGGLTLIGGTASGDDLTLQSTSNATKGSILFGTSAYDEVNNRLGIVIPAPTAPLDVGGTAGLFTDSLALTRYTIIRASRTDTASLSGGDSNGQMHLELNLNPSSSYGGLATNTATSFLLTEPGNGQNFTTLALRAFNFVAGHQGTGTVTNIQAVGGGGRNTSTGIVTTLTGAAFGNSNNGGGTVTTNQGVLVSQPVGRTSGSPNSTWTTILGINIQDQIPSGASNTVTNPIVALKIQNQTGTGAYGMQVGTGLNYIAGSLNIGSTSAPTNALDVIGTATASVQVTTPIVSGGTGSGNTLTLKSNDTAWPRTSRTQTDFLTIGASFTYPTGSAASFQSVSIAPSITDIDVANANITTINVTPSWTYTAAQAYGLVAKAGMNFTPTLTSNFASVGSDSGILSGIVSTPTVNLTTGPRTFANLYGITADPRMTGSAGTVTLMQGVRSRGNNIAGTTITTFVGFLSDFQNVASGTVGTYRGLHVTPALTGTTTTFEGVKIEAQTTPTNIIGFYQLGGAMHNRLQGNTMVGADLTPSATVDAAQNSTTAAIPPLKLTQTDVSEEAIRFVGSAAAGTLTQTFVAGATVTTATIQGYVRIYVQDDGNQITDSNYYMPIYTLI